MIKAGLIWSLVFIAIMIATLFWAYTTLPVGQDIPVHWGVNGEPDDFATRMQALLMLAIIPGSAVFTTILFVFLPRIAPMRENLYKSRKAYFWVWVSTMALLTAVTIGICISMIRGATEPDFNTKEMVRWIIAACGLMFIVLGNYLPKTRQNYFLGIRTPWTLTSDITWEKTHRLGGKLFMLAGIFGMLSAFTLNGIWLALSMSGLALTSAFICIVYSFFVWRTASDKRTPPDYIV